MCVNVRPFQVHTIRTPSKTEIWIQFCKNTGNKTKSKIRVGHTYPAHTLAQEHNTHHTNIQRNIWPDDECSKNWRIQKALHPSSFTVCCSCSGLWGLSGARGWSTFTLQCWQCREAWHNKSTGGANEAAIRPFLLVLESGALWTSCPWTF